MSGAWKRRLAINQRVELWLVGWGEHPSSAAKAQLNSLQYFLMGPVSLLFSFVFCDTLCSPLIFLAEPEWAHECVHPQFFHNNYILLIFSDSPFSSSPSSSPVSSSSFCVWRSQVRDLCSAISNLVRVSEIFPQAHCWHVRAW